MFNKIVLSAVCCSFLLILQAQDDNTQAPIPNQPNAQPQSQNNAVYRPAMEFGISGGGGLSILYNQHPYQNPRTPDKAPYGSTDFGLSYQYNFPQIVSIRAELNLERKGDEMYSTTNVNLNPEGQLQQVSSYDYDRFNYLTLPVMARLSFGKRIQFFTDLGVYGAALFNATRVTNTSTSLSGSNFTTESGTTTYMNNGLHNLDAGVVTGVGLSVPVWRGIMFNVEARNNVGLVNINANNEFYGNKLYNDNFVILAGLDFMFVNQRKTNDRLPNLK